MATAKRIKAWKAKLVPGKQYQVEYTTNDLAANPSFTSVGGVITAAADVTQTAIPSGLLDGVGHYASLRLGYMGLSRKLVRLFGRRDCL